MLFDAILLKQRAKARLKELGKSERKALKSAGLPHDYLQPPRHPRKDGQPNTVQLDVLLKLAPELNWTPSEWLGVGDVFDPNLLALVVRGVFRCDPDQLRLVVELYAALVDRQRTGKSTDDGFMEGFIEGRRKNPLRGP